MFTAIALCEINGNQWGRYPLLDQKILQINEDATFIRPKNLEFEKAAALRDVLK
jgi:hypothetical protein